jgi:hypothetical protein
MRSQPIRLLALFTLSLLCSSTFACAGSAQPPEYAEQQLMECGGPIAVKVAQRASELALQHAATDEASREHLEQMIAREIKTLVPDYAPDLLQCLVDGALKPHKSPLALMPNTARYLALSQSRMTPRHGFVPITRDLNHERPWHTLLAGARGVRS